MMTKNPTNTTEVSFIVPTAKGSDGRKQINTPSTMAHRGEKILQI